MKLRRRVSSFEFRRGARLTPRAPGASAFTMIEIALCLAIIGFALVAIIGVLPVGMDVQKQNREETIINQDAAVWMDAIRSGARGYDDLTNYVIGITNTYREYRILNGVANPVDSILHKAIYTRNGSTLDGASQPFALTSGYNVIGVLSTPKYSPTGNDSFRSNFVVAAVYALSGAAVEKPPQKNQDVLDLAFSYRLIPEIASYVPFDPVSTNFSLISANTPEWTNRFNYSVLIRNLTANSSDIRLSFAWPLTASGVGNGRQTFRLFTTGCITNEPVGSPLYFIQPSVYLKAQAP